MLNIQVPFLESRVGVARHVFNVAGEQRRTYTIEGCDVTAYARKNEIVAYGLTVGGSEPCRSAKEKCNVNIPGSGSLRTNSLTVGKFISVNGVGLAEPGNLFRAACIVFCGNAANSTVEFHWDGPHSVNLLKIDLIAIIGYGGSTDATDQWENLMTKTEGKNYVINAKLNCDGKYEKIGLQLFWDVEVSEIIVRSGPRPVDPVFARLCGQR